MRSLNARVTLGASLVLATFMVLCAFALERAFRESARSAREERLLGQVYLLMARAEVDAQGHVTLAGSPSDPRLELPDSGLYAAITDGADRVVWRSQSSVASELPAAPRLPPGQSRFEEITTAEGMGYFRESFGVRWATSAGSFPFTFSIVEDLAPFKQQLNIYRRSLWSWLGAMTVLLLLAQWLLLRWGLSPLRRVAQELTRLEHGHQERLSGDYPTEVQRLTDNLNSVLAHERARQKRYRDALADLAHSLKTPLALLRGALRGGRETPDVARTLDEQIERMDRTIGYHLQRAAASGRTRLAAPQPIVPAIERIIAALAKVHADKRVATETLADGSLRFLGDAGDLTEVLGNVLDNAFKWCRTRLRVSAGLEGRDLRIVIEDDGPGIEDAQARGLPQRGVRGDESMPGQGIGLAVTRDILGAYGGAIHIARSALGGAAIALIFPSAGATAPAPEHRA